VDPDVLEARLGHERLSALNNPDNLSFTALYKIRAEFYRAAAQLVLDVPPLEVPNDTLERLILLRAEV